MTVNHDRRYNTAEYRRRKRAFIAAAPPICVADDCPVPGRVIDKNLSGNHRLGPTIDHTIPTSKGGDFWDGWQLMHRVCNLRKGDRPFRPRHPAICRCGKPTTTADGGTHACW